jgi:hypothetical protein
MFFINFNNLNCYVRFQDMIYIILLYIPSSESSLGLKLIQTQIILCLIFIK